MKVNILNCAHSPFDDSMFNLWVITLLQLRCSPIQNLSKENMQELPMFVIKFIFSCRLSLQQTPSSTIILIIWVCLKIGYDMLWLFTNSWLKNVSFLCQNDHLCGKQPHFQAPFPLLLLPPHQSAMPLPACQSPSRVQQVSGFKILTAAGGWTSPQHSMDWLTGNHCFLQLCFKGFPETTTIIQFSRYVGFMVFWTFRRF